VARLVTTQAVARGRLTEPGNQAPSYALRHTTSLSKFPCFLEFSLVKKSHLCVTSNLYVSSTPIIKFTSRRASWRL